jgi:hypothetical protein
VVDFEVQEWGRSGSGSGFLIPPPEAGTAYLPRRLAGHLQQRVTKRQFKLRFMVLMIVVFWVGLVAVDYLFNHGTTPG